MCHDTVTHLLRSKIDPDLCTRTMTLVQGRLLWRKDGDLGSRIVQVYTNNVTRLLNTRTNLLCQNNFTRFLGGKEGDLGVRKATLML